MDLDEKTWLSEREAADYLGFVPMTLYKWRRYGRGEGKTPLPYHRVGRRIRYEKTELDMFMRAHATVATTNETAATA